MYKFKPFVYEKIKSKSQKDILPYFEVAANTESYSMPPIRLFAKWYTPRGIFYSLFETFFVYEGSGDVAPVISIDTNYPDEILKVAELMTDSEFVKLNKIKEMIAAEEAKNLLLDKTYDHLFEPGSIEF